MSNVRFLDQVSVSSFGSAGDSGTGDTGSLLITASEALNGFIFTTGDNSTLTLNVASPVSVAYDDSIVVSSTSTINFTGSGFDITDAGGGTVDIFYEAFPYTGSAAITGSFEVIGFSTLTGSLFIEGSIGEDALAVYSGSEKKVSVNSEGILALDEFAYTPTAVKGGLMYSASNFWLGIE